MRAIFIAVGSELLEQNKVDTNSLYVTQKLMERGILVDMKTVVGDDVNNLSWMIKNAWKRSQLVIITGGLGPTEDDLTREATAEALGREMEYRQEIADNIRQAFQKRGLNMPEINTRQAFVVKGAIVLENTVGTAPGLYIDDEQGKVLLLPGPPSEMTPMFDSAFAKYIFPLSTYFIYKRIFKFSGIAESDADSRISDVYKKYRNVKTTILAGPGVIELHLLGRSRKTIDEAKIQTDALAEKIRAIMKDFTFTEEDISFEEHLLRELKARGLTLAVAESCTGGGLGHTITNIPGSSEVFIGGVIAYSNMLKSKLLGVTERTLEKKGAVSKDAAEEMARGIRSLTGAHIGLSITGIAGPGGAAVNKPVGLVFMQIHSEKGETGNYKIFPGPREQVKKRTIHYALHLLLQHLKEFYPKPEAPGQTPLIPPPTLVTEPTIQAPEAVEEPSAHEAKE